MAILSSELRNLLASRVAAARIVAEDGAKAALISLAVHHYEPYSSMSNEERMLRNRLRAHGRQLGDRRDPQAGTQEILCLSRECAYQHWHRMLFARFLMENGLLLEPSYGVPVTLQECEQLARERNTDLWAMAGGFAQRMLPGVFRVDDPTLAVALPPEKRQALERLLASLPAEAFTADDSLGWTYQFWQAEEKERVNDRVDSGEKVDGRALPAVTQLFTDDYMVRFLLHNTLGAWYAAKALALHPSWARDARDEEELRRLVSPAGYFLDYLRFVRDAQADGAPGSWRTASGAYERWPRSARELLALDPCCGSGHFLTAVLELLVRIRITEESLGLEEAIRVTLKKNVFGLELDARCTQIAAFNLALTAWKMAGEYVELPPLNVACSGLAVGAPRSEWLRLAGGNEMLKNGMDRLYTLFQQAPELGSLINPGLMADGEIHSSGFHELQPLLEQAFSRADAKASEEEAEIGVSAQGISKAAELLGRKYHLVITNVPYLRSTKQGDILRDYCETYHREAKNDLATVFLDRCLQYCYIGGTVSLVMPQNWLFQTSYRKFREITLKNALWHVLAWLGPGAFEGISGEVVKATLLNITNIKQTTEAHTICVIDATDVNSSRGKSSHLINGSLESIYQIQQLQNPDSRISSSHLQHSDLLTKYANSYKGTDTGDNDHYKRLFWEQRIGKDWRYMVTSPYYTFVYCGYKYVIRWRNQGDELLTIRGKSVWGKNGIAVKQMSDLPVALYKGDIYDNNVAIIIPHDSELMASIWCFCSSPEYHKSVRRIDKKLSVTNATLAKVPFDLPHWQRVAQERYPNGLPLPYSDDPTQWLFHGHPCGSVVWDETTKGTANGPLRVDASVLQVAVARLLGYWWPAEMDKGIELCDEAREWVRRCEVLVSHADRDGIVCLSPLRGEAPAADRLRAILRAAYGDAWSPVTERRLLAAASGNGTAQTLEAWLRDSFFEEHCRSFLNRPFIWHICDGRPDGFHALVNYHKLAGADGMGRRTLEALTYTHLGDWIALQRAGQKAGEEGAEARLAAAQELQEQLARILEGEAPYDVFVRWKSLREQPQGWQEVDANDGVRLNIRPFLLARLSRGRAGAGILRARLNIQWGKDRGKEPEEGRPREEYPWFWGCDPERALDHALDFKGGRTFDGSRWNSLHYSRQAKTQARAARRGR